MSSDIITMTPDAAEHIQQKLTNSEGKSHFRLGVKRTGCSGWMYVPELIVKPEECDVIACNINDVNVYVKREHISMLQGTKIDYVKHVLGLKELRFNNPNAESLCGCGESFNLKVEFDND